MDMETRRDMETMAEWAATQDAYDRLLERRARRRRTLRFWLSPWQVADGPSTNSEPPWQVADIPSTNSEPGLGSHTADSGPVQAASSLTPAPTEAPEQNPSPVRMDLRSGTESVDARVASPFDPVAAVPASGECSNPRSSLGAGSGVAGFRDVTSTHALTPLASGSRLPGGPHHF